MKIVGIDAGAVELALLGGGLRCPSSSDELAPWGHGRLRVVRCGPGGEEQLRPRRGRCRSCRSTHVLLPERCLRRRRDDVEVIGVALVANVDGVGHRPIAARLGVPPSTVRGWLRRFRSAADAIRRFFASLAHALDPSLGPLAPAGTAGGNALAAVAAAAGAAVGRFGARNPWRLASAATDGRLLCNTNCPRAAPG